MQTPGRGTVFSIFAALVLGSSSGACQTEPKAGAHIPKLAPTDFSDLPPAVARDLERQGCRIPQSEAWTEPHNVITGRFTHSTSTDIAVICSIRDTSRVLVYRSGRVPAADSLVIAADTDFLQGDGSGGMEYSQVIVRAEPNAIRRYRAEYRGPELPEPLDHDGIEHIFVGKASVIRYWNGHKWLALHGAD